MIFLFFESDLQISAAKTIEENDDIFQINYQTKGSGKSGMPIFKFRVT